MKFKNNTKPIGGINLTSMIDAMFIILIFFILNRAVQDNRIQKINVPKDTSSKIEKLPEEKKKNLIEITKTNEILLNGVIMNDKAALVSELKSLKEDSNINSVLLRGDKESQLQQFIVVYDAAKLAGIQEVNIVTTEDKDATNA